MTIDTGDLDRLDIAPVQLPIAVAILFEMAVHTVHAFFEMDVLHVYRDSGPLFGAIGRFAHSARETPPSSLFLLEENRREPNRRFLMTDDMANPNGRQLPMSRHFTRLA